MLYINYIPVKQERKRMSWEENADKHRVLKDNEAIYSWFQGKENDSYHSAEKSQAKQVTQRELSTKFPSDLGIYGGVGGVRCPPPVIYQFTWKQKIKIVLLYINKRRARALNQAKYFSFNFLQLVVLKGTPCTNS